MSLRPVTPQNSMGQNLGQLNDMVRQLNKEQSVKTFKQAGGNNAIINGRLPFDTDSGATPYGSLYYDTDGVPSIIIGVLPDNTIGLVIAKEGENVIDAFS